jgi:hypothetical protein
MITEYLIDCDRLSLEASCRRPPMRDATVTPSTKYVFKKRLYKDYIARRTVLEVRLGTGSLKKLFCNACRKHRPRSYFIPPQTNVSACIRSCIGASGLFRASAHVSLTFNEMCENTLHSKTTYHDRQAPFIEQTLPNCDISTAGSLGTRNMDAT